MTTSRHPRPLVLAGALALTTLVAACGDDSSTSSDASTTSASDRSSTTAPDPSTDTTAVGGPVIDPGDGGDYQPQLDPATFVDVIDNPYLPLAVGSTWVYEGTVDGEIERIEVSVTDETKEIMGITAVVVRDSVYVDDELVEDTYDWFAQDGEGNVWYLGEDSNDFEGGELVSKEGSWEAGVDGARPGIVMLADPQVGEAYRQEFYPGEAEDLGEVIQIDGTETVASGDYTDVVVTRDWNPLDPDVVEEKYYAPGVGKVLELHTAGGDERVELVEFTPGS